MLVSWAGFVFDSLIGCEKLLARFARPSWALLRAFLLFFQESITGISL